MRFTRLLTPSLFASAVLAASGNPSFASSTSHDSNWAGAIVNLDSAGAFQYVSSTVRVPDISGNVVNASGNALIGIDGTSACPTGLLQLGIVFTMATEGPSYLVAYRFGTGFEGYFLDFALSAGDPIQLVVSAPVNNTTPGFVSVHNLNNNQTAYQQFNVTPCGKTVEWVMESLWPEDHESPLANFGTVVFEDAQAGGGNDYGPQNVSIVNIIEQGKILTSAWFNNDSVTVKYL